MNAWVEYPARVLAVGVLVVVGLYASYWSVKWYGAEGASFAFLIGYLVRPWCEKTMDFGETEQ